MRVGFFAHLAFHGPILQPICESLASRARTLLTADPRELVSFRPDVVVMAGHAHLEAFRHQLPRVVVVNVRHGMVSKHVVRRLPARRSARWFDFVCIGAEPSVPSYEQNDASPREYWHTGYPQLDPLFRRDSPPAMPLPSGRKTILYAPTWNLGLTSAAMLGRRVVELIRRGAPDANVIIKPHPVIGDWRPRWMATWAQLDATDHGVHLVRDTHADVTRYMLAADVLVSDASSAIFEFLALDRPIVLVTNPDHAADPAYDPGSILWTWRDVGEEVHRAEDLPEAMARAVRRPDLHAARRQHYARALFGPFTDGRNHERVAERVLGLEARLRDGSLSPDLALSASPAPQRTWLELRTRLGVSRRLRRALFPVIESLRLKVRGMTRSSAVARLRS